MRTPKSAHQRQCMRRSRQTWAPMRAKSRWFTLARQGRDCPVPRTSARSDGLQPAQTGRDSQQRVAAGTVAQAEQDSRGVLHAVR